MLFQKWLLVFTFYIISLSQTFLALARQSHGLVAIDIWPPTGIFEKSWNFNNSNTGGALFLTISIKLGKNDLGFLPVTALRNSMWRSATIINFRKCEVWQLQNSACSESVSRVLTSGAWAGRGPRGRNPSNGTGFVKIRAKLTEKRAKSPTTNIRYSRVLDIFAPPPSIRLDSLCPHVETTPKSGKTRIFQNITHH